MKKAFYTANEFIEELNKGSFSKEYSICGLVKTTETPDVIFFSPGSSCGSWISIALELIERIEYIQTVPCKDHEHPFVCLFFKIPQEGIGSVLMNILKIIQSQSVPLKTIQQEPTTQPYLVGLHNQHNTYKQQAHTSFITPPSANRLAPARYDINIPYSYNPCGPYRRLYTSGDSWWCCDLHWNICCDDSNLGCKWCI